jgi:hypothetical protein
MTGGPAQEALAMCGYCPEWWAMLIPDALLEDTPMGIPTPEAAFQERGWQISDDDVRCPQHAMGEP